VHVCQHSQHYHVTAYITKQSCVGCVVSVVREDGVFIVLCDVFLLCFDAQLKIIVYSFIMKCPVGYIIASLAVQALAYALTNEDSGKEQRRECLQYRTGTRTQTNMAKLQLRLQSRHIATGAVGCPL